MATLASNAMDCKSYSSASCRFDDRNFVNDAGSQRASVSSVINLPQDRRSEGSKAPLTEAGNTSAADSPETVKTKEKKEKGNRDAARKQSKKQSKTWSGENTRVLDSLITLAEAKSSKDEKDAAFDYVKTLTGPEILAAIKGVSGQRLEAALNGVREADRLSKVWNLNISCFSLSGLGLALVLAYCFSTMPVNAVRCALSLLYHLLEKRSHKGNPKGLGIAARLTGCSPKRISEGVKEIFKSGLSFRREKPNAPGAGRPTTSSDFSADMALKMRAAGINDRDIEVRQRQNAKERTIVIRYKKASKDDSKDISVKNGSSDAPEDDKKTSSIPKKPEAAKSDTEGKDAEEASAKNGNENRKEDGKSEITTASLRYDVTWEELLKKYEELEPLTSRANKCIDDLLNAARSGSTKYLKENQSFIVKTMEGLKNAMADQAAREHPASDGQTHDQPQSEFTFLYSILEGVMATLEAMVKGLTNVWNSLKPEDPKRCRDIPYFILKGIRKGFRLKPYTRAIEQCWFLYRMYIKVEKKAAEAEKAAKDQASSGISDTANTSSGSETSAAGGGVRETSAKNAEASDPPAPPRPNFMSGEEFLTRGKEAMDDLETVSGWLTTALTSKDGDNDQKLCHRKDISEAMDCLNSLKAYLQEQVFSGNPCEHRDTMAILSVIIERVRAGFNDWKTEWCHSCTRYHAGWKISQSVLSSSFQGRISRNQTEYSDLNAKRNPVTEDGKEGTSFESTSGAECSPAACGTAAVAILGGEPDGKNGKEDTDGDRAEKDGTEKGAEAAAASSGTLSDEEKKERTMKRQFVQNTVESFDTLIENFGSRVKEKQSGRGRKGKGQNNAGNQKTVQGDSAQKETAEASKTTAILPDEGEESMEGAIAVLKDARDHLAKLAETLEETFDPDGVSDAPDLLEPVFNAAVEFTRMLQVWLERWKKTDSGEYVAICYSQADSIRISIVGKETAKRFRHIWYVYESEAERILHPNESGIPTHYIDAETMEKPECWFAGDCILTTERQLDMILKLWREGKDPTDLVTWIEYIIGIDYDRNYGSAWDKKKCVRITRQELRNAVIYFTGFECSDTTLHTILHDVMGYSLRQAAKLDQLGEANPLRNRQYLYIQSQRDKADPKKTLVISIDTKAFVVLGRLKHDSGALMSCPGGVFTVYDHDFPFTMEDIYPNGTTLVGKERMKEKAVLYPVGVYCPNDKTGYVSLVLGKDTSEAMCNLIRCVIDIKKKTMPELENVLILADGGGSNASDGVQWKDQLMRLADDVQMDLQVCHFTPGTSKHDPIEHCLWAQISIQWKGKPFLDIEHVARYIEETRTTTGLRVWCWFDQKKYLTVKERKALGEHILTGDELKKNAGGRIEHQFTTDDGDMYKWNYIIHPKNRTKAA